MTRAEIQAEHARLGCELERARELLGDRALTAQLHEYACGGDAADLAEVLMARMAGHG